MAVAVVEILAFLVFWCFLLSVWHFSRCVTLPPAAITQSLRYSEELWDCETFPLFRSESHCCAQREETLLETHLLFTQTVSTQHNSLLPFNFSPRNQHWVAKKECIYVTESVWKERTTPLTGTIKLGATLHRCKFSNMKFVNGLFTQICHVHNPQSTKHQTNSYFLLYCTMCRIIWGRRGWAL